MSQESWRMWRGLKLGLMVMLGFDVVGWDGKAMGL